MQLTKYTDYAFRILIYLAGTPSKELATIQEIAETFQISRNHIMKIVQKLVHAGILISVRGQQGGIKLGKPPENINVRSIIEITEVTLMPVNCQGCILDINCQLKKILYQAQEAYLQLVSKHTLADLLKNTSLKNL